MSKIARLAAIVTLCISSAVMLTSDAVNRAKEERKNIVVEIDYGDICQPRTVEVPKTKDKTVLEILQTIAKVETYPAGQHVFVTAIDEVKGKRGEMGWYYEIDGKSADKLAFSNVANDVHYIKWTYKKDVCSEKVDGKK